MAATSALIHLLNTGDHVVSIDDVYGGTQRYFRRIVHPVRITLRVVVGTACCFGQRMCMRVLR